jgi:hypothetical protein
VDADEAKDEHFAGVETSITDDIDIPGVGLAGPAALDEVPAPQVEIYDIDIPHDEPDPI